MFLLSAVTLLSLAFPSPASVAWHKSFSLKGQPEIRVASSNADVRVYASDRKDIEAVLYTDRTISEVAPHPALRFWTGRNHSWMVGNRSPY
jgi:hypothetical protein